MGLVLCSTRPRAVHFPMCQEAATAGSGGSSTCSATARRCMPCEELHELTCKKNRDQTPEWQASPRQAHVEGSHPYPTLGKTRLSALAIPGPRSRKKKTLAKARPLGMYLHRYLTMALRATKFGSQDASPLGYAAERRDPFRCQTVSGDKALVMWEEAATTPKLCTRCSRPVLTWSTIWRKWEYIAPRERGYPRENTLVWQHFSRPFVLILVLTSPLILQRAAFSRRRVSCLLYVCVCGWILSLAGKKKKRDIGWSPGGKMHDAHPCGLRTSLQEPIAITNPSWPHAATRTATRTATGSRKSSTGSRPSLYKSRTGASWETCTHDPCCRRRSKTTMF